MKKQKKRTKKYNPANHPFAEKRRLERDEKDQSTIVDVETKQSAKPSAPKLSQQPQDSQHMQRGDR